MKCSRFFKAEIEAPSRALRADCVQRTTGKTVLFWSVMFDPFFLIMICKLSWLCWLRIDRWGEWGTDAIFRPVCRRSADSTVDSWHTHTHTRYTHSIAIYFAAPSWLHRSILLYVCTLLAKLRDIHRWRCFSFKLSRHFVFKLKSSSSQFHFSLQSHSI